ncbi:MAG TPA: hypothetical protein VN495_03000 [Candidatus Paceibacterota bacterium]|nr:hypothetical protein [Candidatus Paceibacterota bacterium]
MKKLVLLAALLSTLGAGVAQAQLIPDISTYIANAAGQSASVGPASRIDLLYDTDSYTPPFYRGRALASAGTIMHFTAIPHFAGAGGAAIPTSSITFTWKIDGRVEGEVSGKGAASVALPSPTLYGRNTIEVDANAGGGVYGSASITIAALDPEPMLYEDHPLYGIEYYNALGTQTTVPDIEMTFAAIPFFAQAGSASDASLTYQWSVNGQTVAATSSNENEITINASNSNGLAALAVSLSSRVNAFLAGHGTWNILFSRAGQ